jgi:hypothetical protein
MKKLLIGTALLFAALPFTLDGVTPTVSKAQAWYRGIHHRHVVFHRRPVLAAAAVGAAATGAGLGWGGWGWNRPLFASAVGVGGLGLGMGGYGSGMGAFGCYPTFDSSTGWNQFCVGRGFLWGTGQSHQ